VDVNNGPSQVTGPWQEPTSIESGARLLEERVHELVQQPCERVEHDELQDLKQRLQQQLAQPHVNSSRAAVLERPGLEKNTLFWEGARHFVVAHKCPPGLASSGRSSGGGEVTLEVHASVPVGLIKKQAHDQLQIWYRFRSLSLDENDKTDMMSLPSLEQCHLYTSSGVRQNQDVKPLLLADSSNFGAVCDLEEGSQLFLWGKERES
jgi:hypothetical protein